MNEQGAVTINRKHTSYDINSLSHFRISCICFS